MKKSQNPKIEQPERVEDTRRKGKKSVAWQDDPEILQRLARVAMLMNEGKNYFEIMTTMRYSRATAKRDIARVRELWREDAKERLQGTTDQALAQYGNIIQQAYEAMKTVTPTNPAKAAYLNVILRAQDRIDKVTGIADPVSLAGPNGGPIPVEVTDIEEVRKKRWETITGQLAKVTKLAKETNDGTKEKPK